MKKSILLVSLFVFALQIHAQQKQETKTDFLVKMDTFVVVPQALNFIVLGDWGRKGEENQQMVADQMELVAKKAKVEFIVTTGDNIYPHGVVSTDDSQWKTSFEDVYRGAHLFVNWYPTLGNHDYAGSPEAEIAYSKKSRRWVMPHKYYQVNKETCDKAKISLSFIDSNPYQKGYYRHSWYKAAMAKTDSAKENRWLDSVFNANSKADWKFVFAHHPFYSSGIHKDGTNDTQTKLVPLFNKYLIDVYFAGHEHHLEHDVIPSCKTHQFISGAGSELRPVGKEKYALYSESINGFMLVSVTAKETLVQVIDVGGQVTYKYTIRK